MNIQEVKKEIKQRQEELNKEVKKLFFDSCKDLFKDNKELESFGFKAYIPFFCDGDPCTFSALTEEPDINEIDGYDICEDEHEKLQPLQKKVAKFLSQFDDDDYQSMFGDDVVVKVTKNGIEVEEYGDHD